MKQIEWIILKTDDYTASKTFYADVLKLSVVRDIPDDEFTQFKLENCFLAIYGSKQFDSLIGQKHSGPAGGAIYTFSQVENVDQSVKDLKNQGVKFIKDPVTQPWGQRTAYFTDPDGHIWEIQQWIK
jgi:lactoylglutathione lyase